MPFPSPSDRQDDGPALYIVSTPIGNLEDITLRALRVLKEVSLIAAEDTRHTRKLLSAYEITTRMMALHEHNEEERASRIVAKILAGESVALVTDAGTPCISDPGYRLVSAATREGVRVVPVPGASALLAGLAAAGLPTDAFHYQGFLPKKQGKRRDILTALAPLSHTFVLYESPSRIQRLLGELESILGDRPAVLARELTKRHEEFLRGTLSTIARDLGARPSVKGECTLMVGGATETAAPPVADLDEEVRRALEGSEESPSRLAKSLAKRLGLPKGEVYDAVVRLSGDT
ncbi:16S rRNA (cytidine(1402)-2'-O)-methyltransferase [Desulfoluna spongiiphila]|uniref:Ribosomal RNA small subunit methyltransferase I n=1 Tax=Desulfoluna spongiiphila TaxID=419481 RepID=A0A1G5GFT6_9BACT|nr:16S rRNA (cytidine(1402)-2'-O)-methyltransferase [Desulfoluna spongiiphila]SCY50405.1 16S rRNA (cytidine1402-2'-O)-methyltransferase [Desulfoluna spongiiphila]VVS93582.1 rrna small subunit methyltransferase i [Desulfoluna spongiiphila]